jgi:RecA/RadA recombinase
MREEKARISEKTLDKVSADLNAVRAKAEVTQKEYLDKMEAHTTHAKHSLSLDKMLGEKKVEFYGIERDLNLREAALVED